MTETRVLDHHASEEFVVCEDCFTYFMMDDQALTDEQADAIEKAVEENSSRIAERYTDKGASHSHISHDNDKNEFSWSQCEMCKSKLGGAKYTITLNVFFQ